MLNIFYQVLVMLLFSVAGFILSKTKLVEFDHTKILSTTLVYCFLPCKILASMSKYCTISYIKDNYVMIFISAVVLFVVFIISTLLKHLIGKTPYEKEVVHYCLTIPNFSYMGYAFCSAVFGDQMLTSLIIFALPFNLYTNSYGFCQLTKRKFNAKGLLNPILIATLIGCVLGLTGVGPYIPDFAFTFFNGAGACMLPISMMMLGIMIAQYNFKDILLDSRVYILSVLRLLVFPILIPLSIKFFVGYDTALLSLLILSMSCGMNTVLLGRLVNEDCTLSSGTVLVSTVLSCGTIPLCLWILQNVNF